MPELSLLNLACCCNLYLNNIIDVLLNVCNTHYQVKHLFVHSTNHGVHGDDIYCEPDLLECRFIWHHLAHLSLQDWRVRCIYAAAMKCMQNLTAFSYGYAQALLLYP